MNPKPLRLTVVGCGRLVTQVHLPNLARMKETQVVALVDPCTDSLALATRLAPGAKTFAQMADALSEVPSDAVLIASPSGLHGAMALQALDAGRHVYLEKPIATDMKSARCLIDHPSARQRIMVGFNYRFHLLVQQARRLFRAGTLGDVVSMRTVFSVAEAVPAAWRKERGSGGGALLDLATHDVDLIRFVTGREILAVDASIGCRHTEDDTASLLLHLEGGATAQCLALYGCAETARMEVIGESGAAIMERYRSNRLEVIGRKVGGLAERVKAIGAEAIAMSRRFERARHPWNDPSFAASLQAFVASIRSGKPPRPGIVDGIRSLEVLLAAEESSQSGKRVILNKAS